MSDEDKVRGRMRRFGSDRFRMAIVDLNFSPGLIALVFCFHRSIFILILYVLVSRASLLSCEEAPVSRFKRTGGAGKALEKFLWFVFGPMSLALRFFV